MRGATAAVVWYQQLDRISTHTPHAGRDDTGVQLPTPDTDFYSHAPCGARRYNENIELPMNRFLLTRPMRGATNTAAVDGGVPLISTHTPHAGRDSNAFQIHHSDKQISTHTPHAGRDPYGSLQKYRCGYFYSHAPCGARRLRRIYGVCLERFLLTRPMRGATITRPGIIENISISTHTPHAGRDRQFQHQTVRNSNFYSHAPCGARRFVDRRGTYVV